MSVCMRDLTTDEYPKPCPDCGHTALAHPFRGNVVENGCIVCGLLEVREEMVRLVDVASTELFGLVDRARVLVEAEEASQ